LSDNCWFVLEFCQGNFLYIVTVLGRNNVARDFENGLHRQDVWLLEAEAKALMNYKSEVNITVERPAHSISLQGFVADIDATTELVR
jgi:hypothetical protein